MDEMTAGCRNVKREEIEEDVAKSYTKPSLPHPTRNWHPQTPTRLTTVRGYSSHLEATLHRRHSHETDIPNAH